MTTPAEVIAEAIRKLAPILPSWLDAEPSILLRASADILEALASAGYAIVPKEQVTALRQALNEVITNGEHDAPKVQATGYWVISENVYRTAQDAIETTLPAPPAEEE